MRKNLVLIIASLLSSPLLSTADTFTVRQDDGTAATVDARCLGELNGVVALERRDGRIEVVPLQQVLKRIPANDPKPIDCQEMIQRLTEQFGKEKFRSHAKSPFVIGLVLSEKLKSRLEEKKADDCLKDGAEFMKKVERGFSEFARDLKIEIDDPTYPLVVLVFESDDDFVRFHQEETGGKGLSAESIQGYYNRLTNRLVIRMSECFTFATPLHEAIHQQVYNRGILQRMSHIPVWFDEGIATGFEGEGNGFRIKHGPKIINERYALRFIQAKAVNWETIVADDKTFRGDVLAGEAYANAWSIHWFLVTKYPKRYVEYLKLLRQKPILQVDDTQTRTKDFERIFEKSVLDLQGEFPDWLRRKWEERELAEEKPMPDGYLVLHSNLALVEMNAIQNAANGLLVAQGQLRNISRIRPMSFHITMETDGGTYAEWYLPKLDSLKQVVLQQQIANKKMKNSPGRVGTKFRIKARSAVPDSPTAKEWQRGQLPVPEFSEE